MEDITKTGPIGLKGLNRIDFMKDDEYDKYLSSFSTPSINTIRTNRIPSMGIDYELNTGQNLGSSIFDKDIYNIDEIQRVQDVRAENQPWYAQIGAGLAKGAILAGTTFLDGTLGLVLGGVQAIGEGRASALWDNPFSKAMQSINEWSEEVLPNYYTDAERNEPWYENIFTANFLGDKFIKNLGFTVGAFYGGNVTAAGLKATKLPQIIGALTKSSKAPKIITSGVGSVISAVNEGRIEALNNSKDWFNLQKTQLDDQHNARLKAIEQYAGTEMYIPMLEQENANYEATLGKLTEDRLKMGNADLLMNIPILTASNLIQFGRMYANGFKTARKATNIVGKAGEYATDRTIGKGVTRAVLNPLSEGLEEISQGAAATISGLAYEQDVNNFYKAKINPEAEQQTIDWIKAFSQGINETVNDGSSWEEFFIGSLTGALGMPRFRGIRNSDGRLQSPITFEGGIRGEFREYKEKMDRDTEIANYMNNRVQSPEFKNYYQGLIRHNKYQNDMNQAVEDNNEFDFKNAEHAQLVSDIAMFDNAGKLEDLTTLINSAYDISDENLASIVENTTSTVTDENGKESKVGPFIDKNGNPMYSTPEGKQEMIDKLTKTKDEMLNTITNYTKIKDNIDIRTGEQLSDEQLEELTWLKSQIGNWQDRARQLSSEVKPTIDTILGSMSQLADMYNSIKNEEGKAHAELTDLYNDANKNEKQLRKNMSILETVKGLDDKTFAYMLSKDSKLVKSIKSTIDSPLSGVASDDIQIVNSKIDDIVKLVNATENYNIKLKEYLENPTKLQKDIESATETIAKEETKRKSDNLKSKLIAATNLTEFRQALNEEDNITTREETLKSLEEENNEMAKNYREVTSYNNDVQRVINSLDESSDVKAGALKLFQDQFKNSSNLSDIANPNSIYVDNADALYDDNLTPEENAVKFQEAQYTLLRAMNQINNENRFKDRFSKEYKELKLDGKPNLYAPERDVTGDSGTTTVPSVNIEELPITTYEPPVGNVTSTEISEENRQSNESIETQQSLDSKQKGRRPYYRPAIPELHIQGTKEGDFRPFNVVAAEKEKGVNFDTLYNYLNDNSAFTYVNEGNLKVGDEIGFMIDPALEEQMKGYSWYSGPTILLIDKKNNQVVGSLDESQYSVDRYEGLADLEERIKAEFTQRNEKDKKFIAAPTTKVSKVMIGKIPYSTEERSLANIPNVSSEGRAPIFGIIKNGTLTTNGKVDDNLIIKPVDMSQKEGRMYLLIPNAAGKYSPAAVRVKHFNNEEFNMNDITINSTLIGGDIKEAITKLANAESQEDVSLAMKDLSQYLYLQDVIVTWFEGKSGNGIVISKRVKNPDGTYKKVVIDGKEQIKEYKYSVYFSTNNKKVEIGGIEYDSSILKEFGNTDFLNTPKDPTDIYNEILKQIIKFNLPIQVSTKKINTGTYNNRLIDSHILTSNIADAKVVSNWFTTDYFDNEGNLHQAINPSSVLPQITRKVETPVGGKEGAIPGIKIDYGTGWYVDLSTNTIRDENGKTVTFSNEESVKVLLDLAWAQSNFGDATQSSIMIDNKVLTPSGKVLDRSNQQYLYGKEAQEFKDKIIGKKRTVEDSKKVIAQIFENQKRVDKDRTDNEFYYILEDDGQYHKYDRVHNKLGSNWVESKKQTEALRDIRVRLSQLIDNPTQYNNYLKYLNNHWKINLDSFSGKTDASSRDSIINIIRDSMNNTNSQRALNAGTAVDSVIRSFFTSNDAPVKPHNMSDKAFTDLISSLTEIRSNIEARVKRFLTNNIVLFQKYHDGTRVAGEVDILSVDANGNFRIYDVKTSRYSFYDFTDKYGQSVNYFKNKSATQLMSSKDYYTLQLSAYKNLFESQYNTPITTLAILPFVLNYNKDIVDGVTREKGIMITYNPNVNVPLVGTVNVSNTAITDLTVPIFNSAFEIQNPINRVLPENTFTKDGNVGYYDKDGKLYKGYIKHIGNVEGINIYLTKERDRGFGREGELSEVSSYYVIFPNGKLIDTRTLSKSDEEAAYVIMDALQAKPQKVKDLASEKTLLFDPISVPKVEVPKIETPATIFSTTSTISGAAKTIQAEQAVNEHDDEFENDLDLGNLRRVDESRSIWNQEKELEWIKKVLPQLSEDDRIRVVKGLIKVGNQGALAWGQFNNGIITLSDIAAEGTTYHEAFHVVFNLLLDNNERQALLAEAKEMYGNKSDLDLEEDMAEGFREYVTSRETKGLLNKIKNFFKDLWIKVTNWKRVQPHLIAYYQMINQGKYANSNIPYATVNRNREEEYTQEIKDILEKAPRDSQGRLLAPNGNISNLTERQYAQVRTKAFKDWFGDWENDPSNASKVVDENGEPLVVYHGTNNEFNIFEKGHGTKGQGFFFTDSKDMASSYGKNIKAVFLNMRDSFVIEGNGSNWNDIYVNLKNVNNDLIKQIKLDRSLNQSYVKKGEFPTENYNYFHNRYYKYVDAYDNIKSSNSIIDKIKKIYYLSKLKNYPNRITIGSTRDFELVIKDDESIIFKNIKDWGSKPQNLIWSPNNVYVISKSYNVKSATDNIGTFDSNNLDIRYRKVPSIQELRKEAKNKYEEYKVKLEEEYRIAQQIVKDLNNKRYYTKEDAMNAFKNSRINSDLFYRLTSYNANNSIGYKIQLLTREAFEEYKDIANPYRNKNSYVENRLFDSLDPEIQMTLLDKGWTKEQFDSISQEERDIAIECIAL